jgi:DNA-binding CsgD family transcriptional regulator
VADLLLGEREQSAVRAVIASEPVRGGTLPGARVLQDLARLIACDAMGIAVLDLAGCPVGDEGPPEALDEDAGRVRTGVHHRDRRVRPGRRGHRGVAVLSLGVRSGPDHVVKLWMVRGSSDFTPRERALFRLVAPALERVLRERPRASLPPSLTEQERRVLHHVADGLTNAEIADRLVVAPSTVRKHLENAYRKLGVTNRLAAVRAFDGTQPAEPAGRHLTGTVA